jgi:hypothetical protein
MSDEENVPNPGQVIGGFLQSLMQAGQPKPTEILEINKQMKNLANALLPALRDMRGLAREIETLNREAPVAFQSVHDRIPKIRKHLALMIDALEGAAER